MSNTELLYSSCQSAFNRSSLQNNRICVQCGTQLNAFMQQCKNCEFQQFKKQTSGIFTGSNAFSNPVNNRYSQTSNKEINENNSFSNFSSLQQNDLQLGKKSYSSILQREQEGDKNGNGFNNQDQVLHRSCDSYFQNNNNNEYALVEKKDDNQQLYQQQVYKFDKQCNKMLEIRHKKRVQDLKFGLIYLIIFIIIFIMVKLYLTLHHDFSNRYQSEVQKKEIEKLQCIKDYDLNECGSEDVPPLQIDSCKDLYHCSIMNPEQEVLIMSTFIDYIQILSEKITRKVETFPVVVILLAISFILYMIDKNEAQSHNIMKYQQGNQQPIWKTLVVMILIKIVPILLMLLIVMGAAKYFFNFQTLFSLLW